MTPLFWLQFAVIAGVFVLARWLLTPLFRKGLASAGGGLHLRAEFPLAIGGPDRGRQPDRMADAAVDGHRRRRSCLRLGALTIVASLLTAWLLIRLVTMLVANEGWHASSPSAPGRLRH